MNDAIKLFLSRLGVGTLAVATICATFPPPAALASPVSSALLAQAYPPPPAYPPTEPPPPGRAPPPAYAPPPPYAPQDSGQATQAIQDAKADVPQQLSGTLWFFAGFFLTWIGILLGYLVEPSPDATRLIGKSSSYVLAYSEAYRREGKQYQGIHAVYGCVTSTAIELVAFVVYLVWLATVFPVF